MSENNQNQMIQDMIATGKEDPSKLASQEVESAIELLHADLRSIHRQVRQRKLRLEMSDEFGKQNQEEKAKHSDWLHSVEKVANNKFDQIRILERVLGEIRSNSASPFAVAHFHVRILKDIALAVDKSLCDLEEFKTDGFSKENIEILRSLTDDLYNVWKDLFE